MDQELSDIREIKQGVGEESKTSADIETRITIVDDETADLNAKSNGSMQNEAAKVEEDENCSSCVIDVKCNDSGGNESTVGESEKVCRICHLSAKEIGQGSMDLIEIGCGCKGELGAAHSQCAEAWFRVKGHRVCEICGQNATNITGVGDNRFMEEWNERSMDTSNHSSDSSQRCLHGQPVCNFLIACLVIAFVLPWFFRVNMF